jgi:hypothetical protein
LSFTRRSTSPRAIVLPGFGSQVIVPVARVFTERLAP